jgi:TetR/AcrR family transcriptional repressor of nem operon
MKPTCATKQRLLETVIDLIWEHNYGSVSVDDICRRAKILKGSFYHFFPSKADLAVAALEERWNKIVRPRLEAIFVPGVPPLDRLAAYCDYIYENQRRQKERVGRACGCPFATIGSEQCTEEEKIRLKSQETAERYVAFIRQALQDAARDGLLDGAPAEIDARARELYSFVLGMLLQTRIEDDIEIVRRFKPAFLRLSGVRRGALLAA